MYYTQCYPQNDLTLQTSCSREMKPRLDVVEKAQELRLYFDLPGVAKENVQVYVENQTLILKAHRASCTEECSQETAKNHEKSCKFYRELLLSDKLDPDSLQASLKNGVLTLLIHKRTPQSVSIAEE